MRPRSSARSALAGALALAAPLALSGCITPGESGVDAELARQRGFSVVSSRPDRVVFAARGQRVAIEPPQGYCLDRKALEVTGRSAFALVTDCLEDRQAEVASDPGTGEVLAIDLPRSFPGILTVSVSGEPALGQGAAALDDFEALLRSESGRSLLRRSNHGAAGSILATRRAGQSLYALIEEEGGQTGFLAPRFWRGFIDINDRLVLVTVSGFNDREIAEDGMMAFLASQMAQLRRANGLAAMAEEDEIAAQLAALFARMPDETVAVLRSDRGAVTEDGIAPPRAPRPPERHAAAPPPPSAPGAGAPARAPLAPHRPG